ncbi:MAG: ABC transporter permease, partial [Lancefieldella rimae]|nr:ABC transporter permease [Lancefieldella rimae]
MAFFTGDKNSKKVQEAQRVATRAARAQEEEVSRTGKTRATSYWAVSWNIFKRNRLGVFCLIVVGLLVLIALFAPVLAPYDFKAQELSNMLAKPGAAHLFGTDEFGRDILSRIIYGCQISLSVGVISQIIALFIGFTAGVLAGYYGGWIDAVVSFVIQVFS